MSRGQPSNAQRDEQWTAALRRSDPLVVTVATVPPENFNALLERDIELVRTGILYADTVSLVSPAAVWMESIDDLRSRGSDAMMRMVPRLSDQVIAQLMPAGAPRQPANWRQIAADLFADGMDGYRVKLEALGPLPSEIAQQVEQADSMFSAANDQFAEMGTKMLGQNRMDELWTAIRSGFVVIKAPFSTTDPTKFVAEDLIPLFNYSADDDVIPPEFLVQWIEAITEIVSRPSGAVLLDEGSSEVARDLQAAGKVTVPRSTRRGSIEALVGTSFIARLPAFPDAPMDELIDLRRDLDGSLGRYRTGVSRVAAALSKEAFSEDWPDEAHEIWQREVAPSVIEINSELADHTFVKSLAKGLAVDSRTMLATGTAVVTGAAAHGFVHNAVFTAIGAALPLATNLLGTEVLRREKKRNAKYNDFFYILELGRRLRDRD